MACGPGVPTVEVGQGAAQGSSISILSSRKPALAFSVLLPDAQTRRKDESDKREVEIDSQDSQADLEYPACQRAPMVKRYFGLETNYSMWAEWGKFAVQQSAHTPTKENCSTLWEPKVHREAK